jgi:hypothetical protein
MVQCLPNSQVSLRVRETNIRQTPTVCMELKSYKLEKKTKTKYLNHLRDLPEEFFFFKKNQIIIYI